MRLNVGASTPWGRNDIHRDGIDELHAAEPAGHTVGIGVVIAPGRVYVARIYDGRVVVGMGRGQSARDAFRAALAAMQVAA